jgi:predicted nuclease with TOPRIM domain
MTEHKSEPEKVPSFKDMQEQYHAVMAFFYKDFATKEDLRETRQELKQEIKEKYQWLDNKIEKLDRKIDKIEENLNNKIDKVSNDLKWFIGAMFIATTTIVGILTYLK